MIITEKFDSCFPNLVEFLYCWNSRKQLKFIETATLAKRFGC